MPIIQLELITIFLFVASEVRSNYMLPCTYAIIYLSSIQQPSKQNMAAKWSKRMDTNYFPKTKTKT